MGRTLFWYVFRDLLRIFVMTAGALAGIMSFGGLLRPLTQQGLDLGQVSRMLTYFTPAMLAYSLPIAALFSATVVYGRLSADNELTACRAGGISLGPAFGMAFPALLFGLLVAIISLTFLCFVVPVYTLKVEKVIYSNLAKLIANRIERTHEVRFGSSNIYADRAYLPPFDPKNPNRQVVVLENPSIVQYERAEKPTTRPATRPGQRPNPKGLSKASAADRDALLAGDPSDTSRGKFSKVPKFFLMGSSATIDITERDDDLVSLLIGLEGGTRFPREFSSGMQAGIGATQFGPMEIPSPIKEDTKFMDVGKLQDLYRNPEKSRKVNAVMAEFVRRDQTRDYITMLYNRLRLPTAEEQASKKDLSRYVQFASGDGSVIVILVLDPAAPQPSIEGDGEELIVNGAAPGTVTFERRDKQDAGAGTETSFQAARELHIRANPDVPHKTMHLTIELVDRTPRGGSSRAVSGNYSSVVEVPMPAEVRKLNNRKVAEYERMAGESRKKSKTGRTKETEDWNVLKRELVVLTNNILAESNGRASFAVSCLILVLVGSSLGMMFKSGNFLTAFAVSFIPALVCITLIVAGQQTCHAVPFQIDSKPNPLGIGLVFIWSGNAINLVIAVTLLWRLQRQ